MENSSKIAISRLKRDLDGLYEVAVASKLAEADPANFEIYYDINDD